MRLGKILHSVRQNYGNLSADQKNQLKSLDFTWDKYMDSPVDPSPRQRYRKGNFGDKIELDMTNMSSVASIYSREPEYYSDSLRDPFEHKLRLKHDSIEITS